MRATLRKLLSVAGRDQLPKYGALGTLMLVTAVLEAIGIGAVIPFLGAISQPDAVLANEHVRRILAAAGLAPDAKRLVALAGAGMIAIFALKGALVLVSAWLQGRLLYQQRTFLSRSLFAHYLGLPYSLFLQKNVAHLMHVVTGVATNFATVFMAALILLAAEAMVCLTIAALLLLVNPGMTGWVAAFMIGVGGSYVLWSKARLVRIGREQHAAALGLNKTLMEGLGSLKETRVMGAEGFFLHRFDVLAQRYMKYSTQLYVLNHAPRLAVETLFVVVVVGVVVVLAATGRDLVADMPMLVLFGMALIRLLPSFNRLLTAFTAARVNLVALNTLFDELDETRRLPASTPPAMPRAAPGEALGLGKSLELTNVSYRYPGETANALDRVSMEIRKGEIIGLVGRSGAGKTTLVDVMLDLLQPQEGAILADGRNVLDRRAEWQRIVGYIPQTIYLIDDTITRNVAFGVDDREIDVSVVRRALAAAQLLDFVDSLPQGLETVVGDRGVRLSGGQRQRVGIARALYRDPQLLILDEATSALDMETESAVNGAIRQLSRSKTLIIIAHRLSTIKDCDRLYLVDEGRIADRGSYAELVERNAWFRRVNELLV